MYDYPLVPTTMKHVWSVKTLTQLEKPRYVINGFQTGRKNAEKKNANQFDHCNLKDVKLFLNFWILQEKMQANMMQLEIEDTKNIHYVQS